MVASRRNRRPRPRRDARTAALAVKTNTVLRRRQALGPTAFVALSADAEAPTRHIAARCAVGRRPTAVAAPRAPPVVQEAQVALRRRAEAATGGVLLASATVPLESSQVLGAAAQARVDGGQLALGGGVRVVVVRAARPAGAVLRLFGPV